MSIRTGLIGRGMAGTIFHAPLIRAVPELELVATAGSADAQALIADLGIELVVVATPNTSHFPLAAAALEAGKHVVIDKPFTITLAEADALIALAEERGRMLTVFHNRRWDGDFLTVEGILRSGRLGEMKRFEAHWDRFRPEIKQGWREDPAPGAGLFFDLGPHLIDQALGLFGRPDGLYADIEVQRDAARVDDYFALTLQYGRMRAILSASTVAAEPRPRFALHGTRGSFVNYGLDNQEVALRSGLAPGSEGSSDDDPAFFGRFDTGEIVPTERGRYLAFYEGVADAILRGAPPPVDPADAREGLRIIELARESAREGRRIAL